MSCISVYEWSWVQALPSLSVYQESTHDPGSQFWPDHTLPVMMTMSRTQSVQMNRWSIRNGRYFWTDRSSGVESIEGIYIKKTLVLGHERLGPGNATEILVSIQSSRVHKSGPGASLTDQWGTCCAHPITKSVPHPSLNVLSDIIEALNHKQILITFLKVKSGA